MRAAVVLAGGLSLAGCSGAVSPPPLPAGWTSGTIPDCCTIGIPPGAMLAPLAQAIDDPVFMLRSDGFAATMTLTSMGSAVPPAASGSGYRSGTRRIDGREARTASFTAVPARRPLPETRYLLWSVEGSNDGTGRNLIIDLSCRAEGCGVFDPLVGSLRVRS